MSNDIQKISITKKRILVLKNQLNELEDSVETKEAEREEKNITIAKKRRLIAKIDSRYNSRKHDISNALTEQNTLSLSIVEKQDDLETIKSEISSLKKKKKKELAALTQAEENQRLVKKENRKREFALKSREGKLEHATKLLKKKELECLEAEERNQALEDGLTIREGELDNREKKIKINEKIYKLKK